MSRWREWLESVEKELCDCTGLEGLELREEDYEPLIEGFRLCAEAVEAWEKWLEVIRAPKPKNTISQEFQDDYWAVKDTWVQRDEKHKAALEWLRGVGR